ncbi:hypothetical protein ACVSQB_00045 [Bradyrhizobium elkanii]
MAVANPRRVARVADAAAAIRIDTPDCFEGYLKFQSVIMLLRARDRERRVWRQHGSRRA